MIKTKRIDDGQVFDFDSNKQLVLQKRTQNCWNSICEWLVRTFTSKMPLLRQQFADIVHGFEIYLENEKNEKQRERALTEYAPVINEIFRCAERMKAAGITGFSDAPSLMRGPEISQIIDGSPAYLLQTHLPRYLYKICRDRDLLPVADQQRREILEHSGKISIALQTKYNWVVITHFPRDSQEEGFSYTFTNRILNFAACLSRTVNGKRPCQIYDLDSSLNKWGFNWLCKKSLKSTLDQVHIHQENVENVKCTLTIQIQPN